MIPPTVGGRKNQTLHRRNKPPPPKFNVGEASGRFGRVDKGNQTPKKNVCKVQDASLKFGARACLYIESSRVDLCRRRGKSTTNTRRRRLGLTEFSVRVATCGNLPMVFVSACVCQSCARSQSRTSYAVLRFARPRLMCGLIEICWECHRCVLVACP